VNLISYIPSSEDLVIAETFHNRCVRCHHLWQVIHEIETRGAIGVSAMFVDNRVPLCNDCHEWAHAVGTETSSKELISCKNKVLTNAQKK
jgi:hypothetical protein